MTEQKVTVIELDANKNELFRYLIQHFIYDSKGNVLEETQFNAKGNVERREVFRYNSDNDIILRVEYDNLTDIVMTMKVEYDNEGILSREETIMRDGSKIVATWQNFNRNRIVKIVDENNALIGKQSYQYGIRDEILSEVHFDEENSESKKDIFEYDSSGNLIKILNYSQQELLGFETYSYTSSGLEKVKSEFDENAKLVSETHSFYDERGNLVKQLVDTNIEHFEATKESRFFEFDQHNNLTKNYEYYNDQLCFINDIEYDDKQRITKQSVFELDVFGNMVSKHSIRLHEYIEAS